MVLVPVAFAIFIALFLLLRLYALVTYRKSVQLQQPPPLILVLVTMFFIVSLVGVYQSTARIMTPEETTASIERLRAQFSSPFDEMGASSALAPQSGFYTYLDKTRINLIYSQKRDLETISKKSKTGSDSKTLVQTQFGPASLGRDNSLHYEQEITEQPPENTPERKARFVIDTIASSGAVIRVAETSDPRESKWVQFEMLLGYSGVSLNKSEIKKIQETKSQEINSFLGKPGFKFYLCDGSINFRRFETNTLCEFSVNNGFLFKCTGELSSPMLEPSIQRLLDRNTNGLSLPAKLFCIELTRNRTDSAIEITVLPLAVW